MKNKENKMVDHTEQMRAYYGSAVSERWGEDYETRRWSSTPYFRSQYVMTKATIDRALQRRSWRRALELGPGPGTWTKLLLEQEPSAEYTLVDISAYMQEQFLENVGEHRNVTYRLLDFESYVPEGNYDLFFSIRAIDYLSNKDQAIKKIAQLLNSDGLGLIIAKMGHPWKKKILGQKTAWQHQHKITPQQLVSLLKEYGCRIETVRPAVVHIPVIGRILWLNHLLWRVLSRIPLGWWSRWLCESYVVVFQKL